ncbi:MAG: hypothetical protein ACOZAL_03430 [Patescibacteria group bacterium]
MRKIIIGLLLFCSFCLAMASGATRSITDGYPVDYKQTSSGNHDSRQILFATSTQVIGTGADTTPTLDCFAYNIFRIATKTSKCATGDTVRISFYQQISFDGTNWFTVDSLVRAVNDTSYKISKWTNSTGDNSGALYQRITCQGRAGNDSTTVTLQLVFQQ